MNPSLTCTVSCVFLQRCITVVSLYLSSSVSNDFSVFDAVLSSLPSPVLLLGDFTVIVVILYGVTPSLTFVVVYWNHSFLLVMFFF